MRIAHQALMSNDHRFRTGDTEATLCWTLKLALHIIALQISLFSYKSLRPSQHSVEIISLKKKKVTSRKVERDLNLVIPLFRNILIRQLSSKSKLFRVSHASDSPVLTLLTTHKCMFDSLYACFSESHYFDVQVDIIPGPPSPSLLFIMTPFFVKVYTYLINSRESIFKYPF